ncbi:MAG: hypothetical protein V4537_15050 [Pseudomonadota bacterium]
MTEYPFRYDRARVLQRTALAGDQATGRLLRDDERARVTTN